MATFLSVNGQPPHPTRNQIERFLRGESPAPERRAVVRHLVAGCDACAAVLRPLWGFADEPIQT